MYTEEYWRFLCCQPDSSVALPSAAGAAASARGRFLDDSALGWPGAGASPARLVGSGRAGAPLEAPLRSGGEEAPRSTRLGRAARDTDRYGLRQGGAGRRAGRGSAWRAWVGRRPLGLRLRPGGCGPPAGSAALGALDAGVRPSGRLNSSGEPWVVRASDGPEPAAFTGTPVSKPPRAPQPQIGAA